MPGWNVWPRKTIPGVKRQVRILLSYRFGLGGISFFSPKETGPSSGMDGLKRKPTNKNPYFCIVLFKQIVLFEEYWLYIVARTKFWSSIDYFFIDFRLFQERLHQVKMKLDEVLTGKAGEYKEPLATLQQNLQQRTQVAGDIHICLMIRGPPIYWFCRFIGTDSWFLELSLSAVIHNDTFSRLRPLLERLKRLRCRYTVQERPLEAK